MTKEQDKDLVANIRQKLIEELNPLRIVLFGSRATGTAMPGSDVDIFIEMDTQDSYGERMRKVSAMFRPRDWSLDAVVCTPEEVAESRDVSGTLINLIEREGKVLYERR
jgi:predicted nucleotidyltransferase